MKAITAFLMAVFLIFTTVGAEDAYAQTEQWRGPYNYSIGVPPNLYPAKDIGKEIGFDGAGHIYLFATSAPWSSSSTRITFFIGVVVVSVGLFARRRKHN